MAASKPINVEEMKNEVWRKITGENDPITDAERKDIDALISDHIKRIDAVSKSLAGLPKDAPVSEIEKRLKPHIADDTMKAIKEAFRIETFTLTIEKAGGTHTARFLRGGEEFQASLPLTSRENILQTRDQQIASLIIEVIFFVLGLLNIRVLISKSQMQRVIREVLEMRRAGQFGNIIEDFMRRWVPTDPREQATAIYHLIVDLFNLGLIHSIVRIVLAEMSILESIRNIAIIAAMITAAVASGGIALIAQIMLALNDSVAIGEKVYNLTLSNELQGKMN